MVSASTMVKVKMPTTASIRLLMPNFMMVAMSMAVYTGTHTHFSDVRYITSSK